MVRKIKNILKVLYDIKPVKNGEVDLEKINSVKKEINLRNYLFGQKAITEKPIIVKNYEALASKKQKDSLFKKKIKIPNLLAFKRIFKFALTGVFIFFLVSGSFFVFKVYFFSGKKVKNYFQASLLADLKAVFPRIEKNINLFNEDIKKPDLEESIKDLKNIYEQLNSLTDNLPEIEKIIVFSSFLNKQYPFVDALTRAKIILKTSISSLEAINLTSSQYLFGGILGDPEDHQKTLQNLNLLEENNKKLFSNLALLNKDVIKLKKGYFKNFLPDKINLFEKKYLYIQNSIIQANQYIEEFRNLLGIGKEKNYFIILQNESEIRPTGGFIGSLTKVSLTDGRLSSLDFFDIYDIDGQIKKKYIPPHQLWNITPVWKTRDANWFFDFEKSAKKIAFFLNSSAFFPKTKIDGIIAINTKIFSDILEVIGPIDLKGYGQLNSKNFLGVLQYNTELGPDSRSKHPKKVLKLLIPKVFEKLASLNKEQKKELFNKIIFRLENKDIQAYFANKTLEQEIKKFKIAGSILNQPKKADYLAVVNANVAGGKTDIFINQKINLTTKIENDGSIIDTLTITRHHFGKDAKYVFWRKLNKDYMQIFVPQDSQILEASGFIDKKITPVVDYSLPEYLVDDDLNNIELGTIRDMKNNLEIFKESEKTVFGGWVYTKPGATSTVVVKYKLPFKINLLQKPVLKLLYQKQSAGVPEINWKVTLPESYKFQEVNNDIFYKEENVLNSKIIQTPKIIHLVSF